MARVIIQLVTWNGEKYIPYLFESLRAQKYLDWELQVLDNGSSDHTVEKILAEAQTLHAPHMIICKEKNIGFAPGHNELFRTNLKTDTEFILLLNQDMCLNQYFLEKLIFFADSHPDAGSMSGRLMKWAFPEKTHTIDSLGLAAFANHRVIDRAGGQGWHEDDDVDALEVFGVSGALPLYRTEALRDVAYQGDVFDEDFFSYKEDVDLAWRLKLGGWYAFTVLDALAYHDRSASGPPDLSDKAAAANRKKKSALANYYSYRNHLLMLIKNMCISGFFSNFLPTLWYESKKAVYVAVVDPRAFWRGWKDICTLLPKMWAKRRFIKAHIRVSTQQVREWFSE